MHLALLVQRCDRLRTCPFALRCTDAFHANRAPDGTYVIPPLQALFTRSKRGFYHDGRYPTLLDVVNHYDSCFKLSLNGQQKTDLVEYLKSR